MVKRKFIVVIGLLAILLIVLSWVSWVYLQRSLPEYKDVTLINGLDASVKIVTDEYGVPSIIASTDRDAFFSLGYLHAQDRLWQLELQRRVGSGRLSEVFGSSTLAADKFLRTMGFYKSAAATWVNLSDAAKESLTAYTAGINQWFEEKHTLPLEFLIFKLEPEPWTVEDSLVWVKMMAFNLSRNYTFEQTRRLTDKLGKSRIDMLMHTEDKIDFKSPPHSFSNQPTSSLLTEILSIIEIPLIDTRFTGSNAWVVSGKYTESGLPILANDPHLQIQTPSVWYMAEIKGDKLHAVGATLVGLPIVIIGRNQNIAWGITASQADVQDLFLERINSKDEYEFNGAWEKMDVREELIEVKGQLTPEIWDVRHTRNGPLISDVDTVLEFPMSIRWSGLEPSDTTYESHFRLNYAQDWQQFKHILREYTGISLNIVFADRSGVIGSKMTGLIPIRREGDGSLPVPGWSDEYQWVDWIPFEQMPEQINPDSGILITANDRIEMDSDLSSVVTVDWESPYRAIRIKQLILKQIEQDKLLTSESMKLIQGDTLDLLSFKLLPYLLQIIPADERQSRAIEYLSKWDGNSHFNSVATSIFEAWMVSLVERILSDELDQQSVNRILDRHPSVFLMNLLQSEDNSWCDDMQTVDKENCFDMTRYALDDALDKLTDLIDDEQSNWQWGDLHKIQYTHTPFSYVPGLKSIFHREIKTSGSQHTVNHGYSNYSDEFKHIWGAGYRQIIDLGQNAKSYFILAPGQSGNPMSKHYDNLIELHRDVDYLNMNFGGKISKVME